MQVNKEDAAKYLRNIGYEAEVINGVVTVLASEDEVIDGRAAKTLKKVKKALTAVGYDASYGVKVKR